MLITKDTNKDTFVSERKERDAKLAPPKLILPSLFLNMRAGKLPQPEKETGLAYMKLPLNLWDRKKE